MEFIETSSQSARQHRPPLDVFFHPRNVAVIGATENQLGVGRSLVSNLVQTPFGGSIYPVNPNHSAVLGLRCYPNLHEIPEKIDLAVIATPARTVPGIVRECVAAGVEGAVVISAGFRKTGEKGAALEQEILREAHAGKMRILGPNCLGIMSPHYGLNATFASSAKAARYARPFSTGARVN